MVTWEKNPSGKFDTNELVLELTVLAYNILRLIGQESLKSKNSPKSEHPVKRRRLRTVIGNLIQIAGHITENGRRVILSLGKSNVWRNVFVDIFNRFAIARYNCIKVYKAFLTTHFLGYHYKNTATKGMKMLHQINICKNDDETAFLKNLKLSFTDSGN